MINDILKNLSILNVFWFIIDLSLILLGNRLLHWTVNFVSKKKTYPSKNFFNSIVSLLNWITIYAVIFLFLFSFPNRKWMFRPLYSQGGIDVSFFLILIVIMSILFAHKLIKLLTTHVLKPVYKHYNINNGLGYTFNKIIYYTLMIIALGISFKSVGIDLTGLGTIFSVLGIGIGFGMRNIAGNFVCGIIILFERPIEVGEVIQLNEGIGRVENIRLRSTIIRTAKEGTLIIPNQYFIEHIIKNRTGSEMIAEVTVSVEYGVSTEKVDKVLQEAVAKVKEKSEGILNEPNPTIRFVNFQNRTIDFLVEIPVINFEIKEQIESKLRHSIVQSFTEEGINLAPYEFSQVLLNKLEK
jgi:small-conductance mechanosensitive channel